MADYRSVVVALKANVKAWVAGMQEAKGSLGSLKAEAEQFAAGDYDPNIGINDTEARREISALEKELDRLGGESTKVNIALVDTDAKARLEQLTAQLRKLGTKVTDTKVDVNDVEAQAKLKSIEASLLSVGKRTADPRIDLQGVAAAEAQLVILQSRLDKMGRTRETAVVEVKGTDRASRSASLLTDLILGLGPAAVASVGVAAGAVGALGASFLAAGGAAGPLGLAIAGQIAQMHKQEQAVTAARKSLDGLDKSSTQYGQQLAKVHALQSQFNSDFGPAAGALGSFEDEWHKFLSDTSGTTNSLIADALGLASDLLPKLEGIVKAAGGSVDKLLGDLREFANGPEAGALLAFFQTRGPAAIEVFASILGNIGKGFVSLLLAFAPVQAGILGGLQDLTKEFADWAAQIGRTQGFQNFLAYVAQTGPRVLAALGAIGNALLAILKAAAPIGSITLPIITDLANVLASIANSPAGPALVGIALALSLVNRALTVTAAIKASQIGTQIAGIGTTASRAGAQSLAAKAGFVALGVGLEILASHLDDSHQQLKDLATVGGAVAIGFGVGGPWGAAIGAGAGLLQVFSQHSQEAAAAQKELDQAGQQVADTLNQETGAVTKSTVAMVAHLLSSKANTDAAKALGISLDTAAQAALGNQSDMDKVTSAQDKAMRSAQALQTGVINTGLAYSNNGISVAGSTQAIDVNTGAVDKAKAAYDPFVGVIQSVSQHIKDQQLAILAYNITMGSMNATPFTIASHHMGTAVDDLGSDLDSATEATFRAKQGFLDLAAAEREAAGILSRSEAFTNFKQALLNVQPLLKANSINLNQNTQAGIDNAEKIQQIISATQAYAHTLHDPALKQNFLDKQVDHIAALAPAWAKTKAQADAYARTVLGLPQPKPTKPVVDDGAAMHDIGSYRDAIDGINPSPHTNPEFDDGPARASISNYRALLDNIDGKTVKTFVETIYQHIGTPGAGSIPLGSTGATGGPVWGGVRGQDSVWRLLMPDEHILTVADVAALGGHQGVYALRAALHGGHVGMATGGAPAQPNVTPAMAHAVGSTTSVIMSSDPAVVRQLRALNETVANLEVKVKNPGAFDQRALSAGLFTSDLSTAFGELMAEMDTP